MLLWFAVPDPSQDYLYKWIYKAAAEEKALLARIF